MELKQNLQLKKLKIKWKIKSNMPIKILNKRDEGTEKINIFLNKKQSLSFFSPFTCFILVILKVIKDIN